jgi:hypothetical protein
MVVSKNHVFYDIVRLFITEIKMILLTITIVYRIL